MNKLQSNHLRFPKPDNSTSFEITSEYVPAGDQPHAIEELIQGIDNQEKDQVLLGVTGSVKTFTIAHVVQNVGRPTIVLAPNGAPRR